MVADFGGIMLIAPVENVSCASNSEGVLADNLAVSSSADLIVEYPGPSESCGFCRGSIFFIGLRWLPGQ